MVGRALFSHGPSRQTAQTDAWERKEKLTRFEHLIPAEEALFYSRQDPNDIRMGDVVLRDREQYANAQVVLIGCPQDEGVRRNLGRAGASRAPAEIRRALYRYPVSDSHQGLLLMDGGNIQLADSLEETHERLFQRVHEFLSDGKKVVVLGGGNDISYPDCRALASVAGRSLVLNLDRHLDVRSNVPRNSGTPYRQLLDEGVIAPALFHEIGINSFANSPTYIHYVEAAGAHIHYLAEIRERGVGAAVQSIVTSSQAEGIFFGFDLDVVRAMEAPGVSDPGPMGLTAREVCEIADVAAADDRTRLIEITEVNPEFDRDGITSKLAANILMRALAHPGKE